MSFGKIEHKITDEEIAKQMAAFSSDEDSDDSDSDEEEEIDFEPKKVVENDAVQIKIKIQHQKFNMIN